MTVIRKEAHGNQLQLKFFDRMMIEVLEKHGNYRPSILEIETYLKEMDMATRKSGLKYYANYFNGNGVIRNDIYGCKIMAHLFMF
jgi:hypothetical protein